jgi:hypothetical protein
MFTPGSAAQKRLLTPEIFFAKRKLTFSSKNNNVIFS